MEHERLTPAFVRQHLRLLAGIDITFEEAAAIIPTIEANQAMLAQLDTFDVQESRPASVYDPTR
jgi:hypothetical protein